MLIVVTFGLAIASMLIRVGVWFFALRWLWFRCPLRR
jgi:hypothetical protein